MEGSARKRPTWAVVMAAAMCTTWVIAAVASAHEILSGPTYPTRRGRIVLGTTGAAARLRRLVD